MHKRLYGLLWGVTLFITIAAFFAVFEEPERKHAASSRSDTGSSFTPPTPRFDSGIFPSPPTPPSKQRKGIYVKTWDWKYDSFGSPYIEGVVVNDSDTAYRFVEVQFEVLNMKGERLDLYTDSTTDLEPNGRWRFRVHVYGISDQPRVQARFLKMETTPD